jgi:hypothetical protein
VKIPDKLPELHTLIPKFIGDVYSYMGSTYVYPENAGPEHAPEHGIIRCGFRLFEIIEWVPTQSAWKVRPFSATLTEHELMQLSEQAKREKDEAS